MIYLHSAISSFIHPSKTNPFALLSTLYINQFSLSSHHPSPKNMQFSNPIQFFTSLILILITITHIQSTITFTCDPTSQYPNGICASGSAESTYPNHYIRVRTAINATSIQNKFQCEKQYPAWWAYCCATPIPTGKDTAQDCVLGKRDQV